MTTDIGEKIDEMTYISSIINIPVEQLKYIKIRRNKTHIIKDCASGDYIRFGDNIVIQKELYEHKKLLSLGFPVASILQEIVKEKTAWYVESNLGHEPFGRLLRNTRETPEFQIHLSRMYPIISRYFLAQQKTRVQNSSVDEAFKGYKVYDFIQELEDKKHSAHFLGKKIAEKLKDTLPAIPSEFTHGDFNPFNILEGGVIDFEDSFIGPIGGDLIAVLIHPFMSPISGGSYNRIFPTSKEYFETIEGLYGENLRKIFDTVFILKLFWWCFSINDFPELQTYRWDHFERYGNAFLEGKSLYTMYREEYGIA